MGLVKLAFTMTRWIYLKSVNGVRYRRLNEDVLGGAKPAGGSGGGGGGQAPASSSAGPGMPGFDPSQSKYGYWIRQRE